MKTILFLDVDGVFSIPGSDMTQRREHIDIGDGHHIVCWPVPLCSQFLYVIGCDKRYSPVWLSAWGCSAHSLTNRAMTAAFSVAYPLKKGQVRYARMGFSVEQYERLDSKLIAATYYLRTRRYDRVVWVEDGFSNDAQEWAIRCNVKLIDTTKESVRRLLLSEDIGDVREFMAMLEE